MKDKIILPITPQTSIRSVRKEEVLFRIPEDCPNGCGLVRRSSKSELVKVATMNKTHPDLWKALGGKKWKPRKKRPFIRYGCPHSLSLEGLQRKRRLERYNQYKDDLRKLAEKAGLVLPDYGWSIYFFFPVPKRWKPEDKAAMHFQMHHRAPDFDNIIKGALDSLRKDDHKIAQIAGVGKFWVNAEQGWIEIWLNQSVYSPNFTIQIDQSTIKSLQQTESYKLRASKGATRTYTKTGKHKKQKKESLK